MWRKTRCLLFAITLLVNSHALPLSAQYFSTPDRVNIDESFVDWAPYISSDGQEIFFTHWSGGENYDIFTARRDSPTDPWRDSESVSELINFPDEEDGVTLSQDGLSMIFGSEQLGLGGYDLWQTQRQSIRDAWQEPINLRELNTSGGEGTPSLSSDGLTLYFSSGCCYETRGGSSRSADIWVSHRENFKSAWSTPVNLASVNSVAFEAYPSISADGLALYFISDRRGAYGYEDIYVATRRSVNDEFDKPRNLGPIINSKGADFSPFIGPDGKLYYTWNVARGSAPWQLWQADPRDPQQGDFDGDQTLTSQDIDILSDAIFKKRDVVGTDLNNDGVYDFADVQNWVQDVKRTWFGDANLDGEFNSSDLTAVFQAGQYEDARRINSHWMTGDWNGDREFDSADLVVAFQDNGYEQGRRVFPAAAVPEPLAIAYWIAATISFGVVGRTGQRRCARAGVVAAASLLLPISVALAVEPPIGLGDYSVGHRRLEIVDAMRNDRRLPIDVWYPVNQDQAVGPIASYDFAPGVKFAWPSKVAHESATIATEKRFPLVVFSPGSWLQGNAYSDLGEAMASHGLIFASITHTGDVPTDYSPLAGAENQSARDRPRDIQFAIDQLLLRSSSANDPLFGSVNEQAIGVGGHSFGAVLAFAAQSGYSPYGIKPDPRIQAIMPISPGSETDVNVSAQAATVPALLLEGTRDFGVNSSLFKGATLTERRQLVTIKDATHLSYENFCERREYAQAHSAPSLDSHEPKPD